MSAGLNQREAAKEEERTVSDQSETLGRLYLDCPGPLKEWDFKGRARCSADCELEFAEVRYFFLTLAEYGPGKELIRDHIKADLLEVAEQLEEGRFVAPLLVSGLTSWHVKLDLLARHEERGRDGYLLVLDARHPLSLYDEYDFGSEESSLDPRGCLLALEILLAAAEEEGDQERVEEILRLEFPIRVFLDAEDHAAPAVQGAGSGGPRPDDRAGRHPAARLFRRLLRSLKVA
jgi:hypothetical protein